MVMCYTCHLGQVLVCSLAAGEGEYLILLIFFVRKTTLCVKRFEILFENIAHIPYETFMDRVEAVRVWQGCSRTHNLC